MKAEENKHYSNIHKWMTSRFGKPFVCENKHCTKSCREFNWCLKKGRKYKKIRVNFVSLCRTCHNLYDQIGVKNKTSKFPGVCWSNAPRLQKRWRATINISKRQKHLGFHATELEAAEAYKKYLSNILWVS